VRVVLSRLATTYTFGSGSKSQELTPSQLLERLGFGSAQLSTPVQDLSGGQQRRLQLLLILLEQPNVLILDEPTNDLDTDMLAAMEDLLDSWPGTLIVVSHDRYFLERVTDQQFGILGGRLRHLPGGVDEYLRLRATHAAQTGAAAAKPTAPATEGLSGAQLRTAQKELTAIERRLEKLTGQIDTAHQCLAEHDQGDYEGLQRLTGSLRKLETEVTELEDRWMELSEELS
jgi:ABC-type multidrug transport system ATPase subunit